MSVTARDLIQGAFEGIRIYAPGEQLLDADAARGLSVLNQMLDSWSNESLTTFAYKEYTFTLIPGQYQYTIGPGGDINQTRPIRVLDGPGQAFLVDNNKNRYPVMVVPEDKWNEVWNVENVTSNLPDTLYYNPQFPLGIININPVPTIGWVMHFNSFLQFTQFTSLSGPLTLPPGYELAIQSNLGLQLEPYYPTSVVTPLLAKAAMDSKGNIKRSNMRENIAEFERVLTSREGAVFNVYTDSYR